MSAANKKYRQLDRKVNALKAKYSVGDRKRAMSKFPSCRGTFDDCPTEEQIKIAIQNKKAPKTCGKCPNFDKSLDVESEKKVIDPEEFELMQRAFGKKKSSNSNKLQ